MPKLARYDDFNLSPKYVVFNFIAVNFNKKL